MRRIAKKQQPFFVIPVSSQVSVPVFRPTGQGQEAVTVRTSQQRAQQGILRTTGSGMQATQLGPMGFLDSEIIAIIQMDYRNFMSIQAYTRLGNGDITENQLLHAIQDAFYMPLFNRIKNLINTLAPRDSGRLRNAMELAAGGGNRGGTGAAGGGSTSQIGTLNPFVVIINTAKVPYAPVVNRMPTPWLQHFGMQHRGKTVLSTRTGRRITQAPHPLYDPQAIEHWYEEIVLGSRQFAAGLWNNLRAAGPLITALMPASNYLSIPTSTKPVAVVYSPTDLIDALFAVRFS